MEVLRQVAHGESNQQIAAALGISEATVRTHVSNILSKLHLASRTQAALYALREGLASLDARASARVMVMSVFSDSTTTTNAANNPPTKSAFYVWLNTLFI